MAFRSQPDPNRIPTIPATEERWAEQKERESVCPPREGVLGLGFTMDPWKKGVIFGKNMIFVTTENGDFKQFMGVWSTQKCGHLREHGKHIAGECSGTCWNIEWCEYLLRKHQSQLNLFNPGVIYPSDYISIISLNIKHQRLNKNTKPPQFRHGNQANSTQIEPILYWIDFELYLKQHISCVSCTIKAWWFFSTGPTNQWQYHPGGFAGSQSSWHSADWQSLSTGSGTRARWWAQGRGWCRRPGFAWVKIDLFGKMMRIYVGFKEIAGIWWEIIGKWMRFD